ncbi:MAG TPA: response regulator [Thermomicrobiales bacterium]|nr:response regulator [Thermomicrobiales bacterium]
MSPARSPDGHQRRILAINNDAMVLGLFRDLLEDEGYRVTTQTYIDKDLGALAQAAPDLVILDYMWAEEDNGWSYLQMLRMDPGTAAIPIVLCTGAVREVEALASHLQDMGVRVVLKPFNIDQLIDVIAEALTPEPKVAANE